MTITSTSNKVVALGNGATTSFNFNFIIPASGNEQIIFTDANGVQTVLTNTQYTLSGFGNSGGGSVLYPLIGSPIAAGTSLTIARILPLVQLTTLSNQGAFYPTVVESALDYQMMVDQQVAEAEARNLQAPIVDATAPGPLPTIAQRAGMVLGFDGSGNPIAVSTAPAGTISSAMAPVVSAATIAAGRTALGIGAAGTEGIGAGLADDGSGNLRVLFTPVTIAGNTVLNLASYIKQHLVTVNSSLTLPRANTLFPGFLFLVYSTGGAATLTPNAADSIQGGSSGAALVIPVGQQALVMTDGVSSWRIFAGGFPTVQAVTASGASLTLDLSQGATVNLTLSANVTSVSVTNAPPAGMLGFVLINITSTGSFNITGWTSTVWSGGNAPTITSGTGKKDTLALMTMDGGSTWRGFVISQNMS